MHGYSSVIGAKYWTQSFTISIIRQHLDFMGLRMIVLVILFRYCKDMCSKHTHTSDQRQYNEWGILYCIGNIHRNILFLMFYNISIVVLWKKWRKLFACFILPFLLYISLFSPFSLCFPSTFFWNTIISYLCGVWFAPPCIRSFFVRVALLEWDFPLEIPTQFLGFLNTIQYMHAHVDRFDSHFCRHVSEKYITYSV